MTGRQRREPKDALVCGDIGERYVGRHEGDPDKHDPGFCLCGLGLDAWVHTDSTHYVETPLSGLARFAGVVERSEIEGQLRLVEPVHTMACTVDQRTGMCRSTHCPHCGVSTGPQGHLECTERPR